jgi:hypothetical protein
VTKKLGSLFVAVAFLGMIGSASKAQSVRFFNGFETDTAGWDVFGPPFDATRVTSGTNGIISRTGNWHAEVASGQIGAPGTAGGNWGGYNDVPGCAFDACVGGAAFPPNGYFTQASVFLDVDGGFANDTRFDLSSAVNQPDGSFRRDFVFNCGFYNDDTNSGSDGTPGAGPNRFICSASNNARRSGAFGTLSDTYSVTTAPVHSSPI